MNCKRAVCYAGSKSLTKLPISHSDRIPTIRTQEYAARKFAETAGIPIEEFFCDIGENLVRLTAPNFLKMLEYLSLYHQQYNSPCLVIIHSDMCVARTQEEFSAVSKAISKVGGIMALSHTMESTVQ